MTRSHTKEQIVGLFEQQKLHQYTVARTKSRERKKKLAILQKAIGVTYRKAIQEALHQDYQKHSSEVDITEIYAVTSEAKHTRRHLAGWMRKHRLPTPIAFTGSSSWVHHEPKGVCLIISPWNFPINLTFGPLISAIAAGNTVIIKPSEVTPATSELMSKIVRDIFDPKEVAIIQGGVEVSTELLTLAFNHIFFTGSPKVGKIVMAAAAKNLSSVTLELGGKSPTIIDQSANLSQAASRIATGKFANNGQICVAPDYILIHEQVKDRFVSLISQKLKQYYGDQPELSKDYNRVVSERHQKRIADHLQNALDLGGKIEFGGQTSTSDGRFLSPTVVSSVPMNAELMTDEIFGPILPIITYTDIKEAVRLINTKEKPLALYIYSKNKKNIDYVIAETRAGGTCINNNSVHFLQTNMPFGGSNNSGIGKSHGYYGFREFSNERGVYRQNIPWIIDYLKPPYTPLKQRIIDLTIKWF